MKQKKKNTTDALHEELFVFPVGCQWRSGKNNIKIHFRRRAWEFGM